MSSQNGPRSSTTVSAAYDASGVLGVDGSASGAGSGSSPVHAPRTSSRAAARAAASARRGIGMRLKIRPDPRGARGHMRLNATDEHPRRRAGGRGRDPRRSERGPAGGVRAAPGPLVGRPARRARGRVPRPRRRRPAAGRRRRPRVRRPPRRPAPARPAPAAQPGLAPAAADVRLRLLHRAVRRRPGRARQAPRPPRGPRRHLPPPDAAAAAARGRQRRRLRRAGLPRGPRRPRHGRRPARPGHHAARPRDQPGARPGPQPRRPRARVGREGARRGRDVPRLLPRPPRPRACRTRSRRPCRRSSPTSRPATSPGTTTSRRGSGRRSTSGSGTSTGPTPTSWSSSPTSSARWPTSGSRCCASTRSRSSGSGSAPPARTSPRCTRSPRCCARSPGSPRRRWRSRPRRSSGPRDLVQYLGQGRHAGRVSDLAYHNSLMVQVWSMLATGDTVLARHALASLPPTPTTGTWITYVRCHDDIGWAIDDRDAAAVGAERPRAPPVPRRLVRRRLPGHLGATGWSSSTTPPPATSGSAAPPPPWSGWRTTRRPGLARLFLAHAVVAGWGGVPVVWSGDELGQPNDPGWAAEPGHEDDNRWAHRPAARLGPGRAARRPAHRARQGLRRAGPPRPGPRRAAPAARLRLQPGAPRHRRRGPGHASASTRAARWCASTTSPADPRPFPIDRLRDAGLAAPYDALGGFAVTAGADGLVWLPPYAAWWVVDGPQ